MKNLKIFYIFLILFFADNLFSQVSYTDATQEYTENLSIDLYALSADFYVGYREIPRKEFRKIIRKNYDAHRTYLSGVKLRTIGTTTALGSIAFFSFGGIPSFYTGEDKWIIPTSIVTLLVGVLMNSVGRSKLKKSVDVFNQVYDYGWKIEATENGVGLVLSF